MRARKPIAKSDQRKIQTFHRVCHEEGVRVESKTRLAERIVSNVEFEIELRREFARSARVRNDMVVGEEQALSHLDS